MHGPSHIVLGLKVLVHASGSDYRMCLPDVKLQHDAIAAPKCSST